jgi:hypothetical protein
MGLTNPTASLGKATSSPALKVLLWLFAVIGFIQTVREWWNGDPSWFVIEYLDYFWDWSLKVSEALK